MRRIIAITGVHGKIALEAAIRESAMREGIVMIDGIPDNRSESGEVFDIKTVPEGIKPLSQQEYLELMINSTPLEIMPEEEFLPQKQKHRKKRDYF